MTRLTLKWFPAKSADLLNPICKIEKAPYVNFFSEFFS